MSVIVVCPTCGEAVPFHRAPVEACPRCAAPYPVEARAAADRALAIDHAPKPALLVLGQFMSAFAGGMFLLFLVLAFAGVGTYSIDQQQVSNTAFLRDGGGVGFALIGGWLAAVAIGLWCDREWARPLMLAYWGLNVALGLALNWNDPQSTTDDLIGMTLTLFLTACIAWWYLYRKPNVTAYFAARAAPKRAHSAAPEAG